MATLVFAKDLIADFHKLDRPVREKVLELPAKFTAATHSGVHLEKIRGAVDPHVRTVRVDRYWRGIVFYPGESDTYVLTRVLGEEDANKYAQRVSFGVNPITGAIEVTDLEAIDAVTAPTTPTDSPGILDNVADDHLVAVGVNPVLVPVLRRITKREELDALLERFPQGQADAIQLLADGIDIDTTLRLITDTEPDGTAPEVDPTDYEAAIRSPASAAEFTVIDTDSELAHWLNDDFELWSVFLHPTQHKWAYKDTFNGPAKLTGTAGTGKTVAALHRAHHLAAQAETDGDPHTRILLTTFTRALATELHKRVDFLCSPAEAKRIDVINVDKLAATILAEHAGKPSRFATRDQIEQLWEAVVAEQATLEKNHWLTAEFLDAEWRTVILAGTDRPIGSMTDYLLAPRPGRGTRLSRNDRRAVWDAVEDFTRRLAQQGLRTFLQAANDAAAVLDNRTVRPYRHVIVDEAQDLHPAQWRLIRSCVRSVDETLPNDLFIVGDAHQRIYDNRVVLSRLGINTRGRSRRLRLNYRTSHQIHRWSLAVRSNEPVDDLDNGLDGSAGSHSAFTGPDPLLAGYPTAKAEADATVHTVDGWIDSGISPNEIAVVSRTQSSLDRIEKALAAAGIEWSRLGDDTTSPAGSVLTGTMHGVKGGEYRCVALVDVGDRQMPLAIAVTAKAADPIRHRQDIERERNLLYVAASRARDQLSVTWNGERSPFLPA